MGLNLFYFQANADADSLNSCSSSASLAHFQTKFSVNIFCDKENSLADTVIMGKALILNDLNNSNQ